MSLRIFKGILIALFALVGIAYPQDRKQVHVKICSIKDLKIIPGTGNSDFLTLLQQDLEVISSKLGMDKININFGMGIKGMAILIQLKFERGKEQEVIRELENKWYVKYAERNAIIGIPEAPPPPFEFVPGEVLMSIKCKVKRVFKKIRLRIKNPTKKGFEEMIAKFYLNREENDTLIAVKKFSLDPEACWRGKVLVDARSFRRQGDHKLIIVLSGEKFKKSKIVLDLAGSAQQGKKYEKEPSQELKKN